MVPLHGLFPPALLLLTGMYLFLLRDAAKRRAGDVPLTNERNNPKNLVVGVYKVFHV